MYLTQSGLDATPTLLENPHMLKGTSGTLGVMYVAEGAHHLAACLTQYGHAHQKDAERLSRALGQARRGLSLALLAP